jgi:hypothetical protein
MDFGYEIYRIEKINVEINYISLYDRYIVKFNISKIFSFK